MKASLTASIGKSFPGGFTLDVEINCLAGVTVLFGASGAGKTLTLNALAWLVRPDRGRIMLGDEILFDAQRGVHLPPRERGIGYLFQSEALFPHMTVEQNLLFPLARFGALESRRRARQMMETFRIAPLGARYPRELSGGEKQRAALARALGNEPRLLLLDEPARGLDYELRMDLYRVVQDVRSRYPIPILLVTHDMAESYMLADRMLIFHNGAVIQEGAPDEIFTAPRDRRVAGLLGMTNVFEATVEHLDPAAGVSRLRTPDFPLSVGYLPGRLLGDRVTVCIPAQKIGLDGSENLIEADLVQQLFTPSSVRLFFRAGGAELECETTRAGFEARRLATQQGTRWTLSLPRAGIHVFGGES